MTFQIKNFVSIVASMVNRVRARSSTLTDFNVGSVNRTMLEATAQEIDELYQQMVAGLVATLPVATYRTFSFTKLLAVSAGGVVRVSITPQSTATLIPAGSKLTQSATTSAYLSRSDVIIAAGDSFGDVPVVAAEAGQAGNLAAQVPFTFAIPPPGFLSAANLVAFINGNDEETAEQQKTRFNDFITTLARGTNAALVFGARSKSFLVDGAGNVVERVAFANTYEPWVDDRTQPVGLVQIFLHNGVGGTSGALIAKARTVLYGYVDPATGLRVPGYKAAGIKLDVIAATELAVSLTGKVSAKPGYSSLVLATSAVTTIATYIAGLDIGQTFILAKVIELVMEIPGVSNFVLTGTPTDLTASYAQKFVPGALAITGA